MAYPRPTPSIVWRLVHEQDVPMRQAAERLNISTSELLVLLATYCPPPAPKPPPRPVAAPTPMPVSARVRPGVHRRIDVVEAWRLAEQGASAAQIAKAMGFGPDGIEKALERESVRRGCPPPTQVAPRQPTNAEQAWALVHVDGLDVGTAARRLRLRPPAVLAMLAQQAPVVREREWLELGLAGEAADGRADWMEQRHAHLLSRVRDLRNQGLGREVIAERLGLREWQVVRFIDEARRVP